MVYLDFVLLSSLYISCLSTIIFCYTYYVDIQLRTHHSLHRCLNNACLVADSDFLAPELMNIAFFGIIFMIISVLSFGVRRKKAGKIKSASLRN